MNPYPERIEELHEFLAARYGQRDRVATEVLLAAMLDSTITGARRPWLMLETDFAAYFTTYGAPDAWFSFGGMEAVRTMAYPRSRRPRQCGLIMSEWIEERDDPTSGGVFVEPAFRKGGRVIGPDRHREVYRLFESMCVRLRTEYPKGEAALKKYGLEAERLELRRLARRVLDNEFRDKRLMEVPVSLLYWCELLQRAAPRQTDWDSLAGSIAAIGRNVSFLYNDGRAFERKAAERVMRDTVPFGTRAILEEAMRHGREGMEAFRMDESIRDEVRRLLAERVIEVWPGRRTYGMLKLHPRRHRVLEDYRTLLNREKEIIV